MQGFSEQTKAWFWENVGTPTEAQTLCWRAVQSGKNVLLSSPTGSGKTLAAFLYFLDGFLKNAKNGKRTEETEVLYISPLKSLGNDIHKNLSLPICGLGLENIVRTAVRTGDTPPSERQAIFRRPANILITTPESFYLLLSSASGRRMLKSVKSLILDEFHVTASSKRGVHMMLSVARLEALTGRKIQKIALSATIEPLSSAAKILSPKEDVEIIAPALTKKTDLLVDTAVPDMRILPDGSIWPCLADRVVDSLKSARTILCFSDGRASCERLAHKINERAGGVIARTHHGCVSKEQRLEAENLLKSGQLRVMAATGSMELGIDVGEIDEVVQIGNPMSVSSLIQRLGRAGHAPGKVSRMRVYPKTAQDTLSCALTVNAAKNGKVEPLDAPEMCMDLLCQHLVSMAAAGEYTVSEAADILKNAYAYRKLTEADVENALMLLAGDYEHALDRPVRARLLYDRIHKTFAGDRYTRMLALSSGCTIPDRGWYKVQLADGTNLGELDEEYVFEARLGDKFMLGAFPWVITNITRDRVIVEKTTPSGAASPFWKGDGAMRAYETGKEFASALALLESAAEKGRTALTHALENMSLTPSAARTAARVIEDQLSACGCLATDKTLVFEHFRDDAGEHQLMVHSPFGGRVNRALGILLCDAFTRITGGDIRFYDDDDGVLLCPMGDLPVPTGLHTHIRMETSAQIIRNALPKTPMFSILFRQNAQRAMLMGARGNARLPLWIQRLRATRALSDALCVKNHPLLSETLRECLSYALDLEGLSEVLSKIASGAIRVREVQTDKPSPMCLNLRRQAEAELMYETVIPSAAKSFADETAPTLTPEPEAVSEVFRYEKTPETESEAHAFLMTTGDALPGEGGVAPELLEALEACGRAKYLEEGLWIAMEHAENYCAALSMEDDAALLPIVRRHARYRGQITAESLSQRYLLSPERARRIIESLLKVGSVIAFEDGYLHKDVYESAQRKTVSIRRRGIETAAPECYAAVLLSRAKYPVSNEDETADALKSLFRIPFSPELIEEHLLPARVSGYREAKLDRTLGRGDAIYKITTGEKMRVTFYDPNDETDEPEIPAPGSLTQEEEAVYKKLALRGASFARTLSDAAGGKSIFEILLSLLKKGLVRQDNFQAVRHLLRGEKANIKTNIRNRVAASDGGRWEIARKIRPESPEALLNRTFDAYLIAARETVGAENFSLVLPLLRKMEYAGLVRRGYFAQGPGGAQFVRERDFAAVSYLLASPADACVCINAADPMQPYGKILKHAPGRSFLRLPSTACVFLSGRCICVLEKSGQSLRVFEPESLSIALSELRDSFHAKKILPLLKKLTVKEYPEYAKQALENAGFLPDSLYYTLFRD